MKLTITSQFQQFMASIGVPFEEILLKADIPNLLKEETLVLTDLEYHRLLQEFDRVLADEQIVGFSEIGNLQLFLPPFFAAMSAKNGIEGIKRLSKYKKLVGPLVIQYTEHEETVSVRFQFQLPMQDLPRFTLLNEQLLIVSLLRTATGKDIKPLLVEGPYEYSPVTEAFLQVRGKVAPKNQLIFKKEDLLQPFRSENNSMWEYLQPEFDKKLLEVASQKTFAQNVQAVLLMAIPSGYFLIEDISKQLRMSARTLQRNLNAENTTFNKELQAAQKILAFTYLQNETMTTTEIAYLLGYADTNSFVRAFKKWTGQTITAYREGLSKK
ncbi:AraC family transcriptional regulator [Lysinibacillus capsici]|uniref:AraC family transcriptional regulator n=1 Tax=Lysinibacillus capsici TaxID=2115968 RepID=UPI0024808961|nr:AraC family transcriptional regulator [Lysinibacillus capsici]